MKFKLPRDKVIASTCGLSVAFTKGVFQLVPPDMYIEVMAAGGISEEEMTEADMPAAPVIPASPAEREADIFSAFTQIVLRNHITDFTAGGSPHVGVVSGITGWPVQAKERDAAWIKFQQSKGE